jgi:hypothetical protein
MTARSLWNIGSPILKRMVLSFREPFYPSGQKKKQGVSGKKFTFHFFRTSIQSLKRYASISCERQIILLINQVIVASPQDNVTAHIPKGPKADFEHDVNTVSQH